MTSPRWMVRDVDALEAAERAFDERYGREARARWAELGADGDGDLSEIQRRVAAQRGPGPDIWDAHAWELAIRIDLLETARREAA